MKSKLLQNNDDDLIETWPIPSAATIGSSVRAKGIFLEVLARLPAVTRKSLKLDSRQLTIRMPRSDAKIFQAAQAIVRTALEEIEALPLLPRELEDILAISSTERHRWLKDGRLPSAGTRTVKLRGRAKKITFHVFNPAEVVDILDQDLVSEWREQDAATAADNRRRAAWKAQKTRQRIKAGASGTTGVEEDLSRPNLRGWNEFAKAGLLR